MYAVIRNHMYLQVNTQWTGFVLWGWVGGGGGRGGSGGGGGDLPNERWPIMLYS